MAIRSFSFTLVALLILTACKSQPPKSEAPKSNVPVINIPTPTAPPPPAPPPRPEPKKVAVILGPGGAKAFAHVGVLKALQTQRVPIDKVIGLEWGALMGALFANKGQAHDLEWKLYKMEQAGLPRPTGFFGRRGDETVKIMSDFLGDAFGRDDVSRAKIPYACPSRSLYTGVVTWQDRGAIADALKRCLPYPPVFKVQGTFLAGASQASEAVEHLAREGYNLIILVNVLGSAMPVAQDALLDNTNHVILWQEVKRAVAEAGRLSAGNINVELINVDTSAFPIMQFDAKKDLVGLGESVGRTNAAALITKYGF